MSKHYTLVEDLIREELMVEYYMRQAFGGNAQRLDEGLASLAKVAKSWPKIKNAIKTIVTYGKNSEKLSKLKSIVNKISTAKGLNPGKVAKWMLKERSKKATVVKIRPEQKEFARQCGVVGEYACDCAGYFWDKAFTETFNELKETIGLMFTTVKTIIGLFGPIGQLISSAMDAAESIAVDLFSGLRNWWTITYNALNKVIKGLVGFDLKDIEDTWAGVKEKVQNAGVYGGATGKAYKDALAYARKANTMLKSVPSNQMANRCTWISCVYYNKRVVSKKEYNNTVTFCNRLRNLNIPSYEQAMKMWPGINRAKDDGTYARNVLSSLPYTIIGKDNKSVVSWFKKSCNVAGMTFAQLKAAFQKIKA